MSNYRTLKGYQKAFKLAIKIYEVSKSFPQEEKYNLTSQIRRSSRSVCANIAEGCKRRRYKDYFLSKMNDAETENCETQVWLDFAFEFKYLNQASYDSLTADNDEVGKLIYYMINNPEKFIIFKTIPDSQLKTPDS